MSKLKTATTTAAGMGHLPDRLQSCAGPAAVERVFERANIPIDVLNDRFVRIPLSAMVGVFAEAERVSGHPFFGLHVGLGMSGAEIGPWFEFAGQAPTLRQGIHRLARAMPLFQNGPRVWLVEMRSGGIMRYFVPRGDDVPICAHSDHNIPLMLGFVRRFLGPSWRPRWIEIDYPDRGQGDELRDLLQCQPLYGRSALSLPLTAIELDTPPLQHSMAEASMCWADVQAKMTAPGSDFIIALEACILLDMFEGTPELDSVARRMSMSKRTLQRRLTLEGQSFRKLLSKVRHRRALSLLRDTDLGLTEIAHRLGYSDMANFTRAFKTWVGYAPSIAPRAKATTGTNS
ncbi:helix-turn-helix transcriptional regulator [Ruegeria lacuscaerulensis]|uniref:helix-turn-helix transcriptional regulator n=1 Tax=Ruegeria lacuscaerulensis TaxID=55218 RepID=UPI00147E4B55|nr:AraC family transcriptional regulator [Ruegeria lacuscaerulensis]